MKSLAILNDKNLVIGVVLDEVAVNPINYVEMENYDESVLGKQWTGEEWIEYIQPPEELRKEAYNSMTHKEDGTELIPWHGRAYTVNGAMADYNSYYYIEPEGEELKAIIVVARNYIKELYPTA